MNGRTRLLTLAALALVTGLSAFVYRAEWTAPPLPRTPVAKLTVLGDASMPIEAKLVPVEEGTNLIPLPVRVSGRMERQREAGGIRHEWPGLYAEARFRGRSVTVRFDDSINRFRITLDGGRGGLVETARPGSADLRLSGLAPGEHVIRAEKISESFAPAVFGGFFIGKEYDALPTPAGPSRLIEFIGDSDTVGYGGTAERRTCTAEQVFATTDSSRSFGPRVAAHFGADYRMIARSGIGLVRNSGGARAQTMPDQYPRALPNDGASVSTTEPTPDIVVVGLGSNDFGSPLQSGEPWRDRQALRQDFQTALIAFLRARHASHPAALVVLLAFGEYGEDLVGAHRAAEEALKLEGARVVLIVLPKLDRRGCHWHPSPRDHALIADKLTAAISAAEPGWLGKSH